MTNRSIYTINNSLNVFLLVWLSLLTSVGYAQRITFYDYKTEVLKRIDNSKNPGKELLTICNSYTKDNFESRKDYKSGLKLIASLTEHLDPVEKAEIYTLIGRWLHQMQFYEDAFYYLYKVDKLIRENPPANKSFYPLFYESFGLSLYYYRRYDDAEVYLKKACKFNNWKMHERIGILNSLGLVYRDTKQEAKAKKFFSSALYLAQQTNDEGWIGVLSGNLGHLLYLKGNYSEAIDLLKYDVEEGLKNNQKSSSLNAAGLLVKIYIELNRKDEAEVLLREMDQIVENMNYSIEMYRVLNNAKNQVFEAQGKYREALESFKIASKCEDTIRGRRALENIKKTEFQIDFEQKQRELELANEREKFHEWTIRILTLLVVLIVGLSLLIVRSLGKRRKREQLLAQLKRERVQHELKRTENEMRLLINSLMEKNALVEQLSSEIESFQNNPESAFHEERARLLSKMQNITILTDDDWLEFKKLFDILNPNFFQKLLIHAPDLTNAEIRLITLIKLNLSNLEMSRVLGISPDSVRKTALRLRKKWNIDQQEDLVKFVLEL